MLNWIVWNICIKMDLALNNLQMLICHKIQPTNHIYIYIYIYMRIMIVVCIYIYMYMCVCVYSCTCIYICVCVCVCAYVCVCVYVWKRLNFDNIDNWYILRPEFVLENKKENSLELWDKNGSSNLGQFLLARKKEKKRNLPLPPITNNKPTCQLVDYAVPPNPRIKIKESERKPR